MMEKEERAEKREARKPFERPALRRAGDWSLRSRTAGWGGHHHHSGGFGGGFSTAGPGSWGGADGGS